MLQLFPVFLKDNEVSNKMEFDKINFLFAIKISITMYHLKQKKYFSLNNYA